MADFLNLVRYIIVFLIGYAVAGLLGMGYIAGIVFGASLVVAWKFYLVFRVGDHGERSLKCHVHVYRRP